MSKHVLRPAQGPAARRPFLRFNLGGEYAAAIAA